MKHTFFTLTLFLLALLSTSCGNKKVGLSQSFYNATFFVRHHAH